MLMPNTSVDGDPREARSSGERYRQLYSLLLFTVQRIRVSGEVNNT